MSLTISPNILYFFGILIPIIHGVGILFAVDALIKSRSAQGSLAWGLSLIYLPYVALPLYLVFGRPRFNGYAELREEFLKAAASDYGPFQEIADSARAAGERPLQAELKALTSLAGRPFVEGNDVELYTEQIPTFDAIFAAIAEAKSYVLVQFFILRDDTVGRRLLESLVERARAGVRVYLLYDEIGSKYLSNTYIDELAAQGVQVSEFKTTQGFFNTFQLNFRNHRKIVVVDGGVAFVGGNNIGDEYLGLDKSYGPWKDAHIRVEGAEAGMIQVSFLRDWYWATRKAIDISWPRDATPGSTRCLTISTGPEDPTDRCLQMFIAAIDAARERLWIASPYFVPDEAVVLALQLAKRRGVDVRILLPKNPDLMMVWLASFPYVGRLVADGIRVFRYRVGFMHQKVLLVDSELSAVGTANLDNRSFRLNFEVTVFMLDVVINARLATSLEHDFSMSVEETTESVASLSFLQSAGGKIAGLLAPIL